MEKGFQNKTSNYGTAVNSYDLLKFVAIITMVIDHVGFYFYPEQMMYRMVGRVALPCFLFLVGYSGKWQSKLDLWVMAALMETVVVFTHGPILPTNILFTIIAARYIMAIFERKKYLLARPYSCAILSMAWAIPTLFLFEYGTAAALYTLAGYYVKEWGPQKKTARFLAIITVFYFIYQWLFFETTVVESMVFAAGMIVAAIAFYHFKLAVVVKEPGLINTLTRFIGRNSLYIYMVHVILFRLIAIEYFSWGKAHLAIF